MLPAFRALGSRNFRIFLAGQGVGLVGTWAQRIAMVWLVYRITGSALLLGVAAFAAEIPLLLISPFGGVIADRVDRRRALMAVQIVSALQAFTLGVLAWAGLAGFPVIVCLAVLLGVCQAIEGPLRQSMYPELIADPGDLPNAIALMAFMNNAGRLIGPTVAGFMIGAVGEMACFFLNGFGYLFVVVALSQLRVAPRLRRSASSSVLADMRDGMRYVWRFPAIRSALGLLAVTSFCGLPYLILVPVFTREVLHAEARTLGYLLSGAGAGAGVGLVLLALRVHVRGVPRLLSIAAATTAGAMLALAAITSFWPAFVAMTFVGFGIVVTATASNILLQSICAPDKRGRVLGLFSTVFFGIAPIGNFVAGSLAEAFGCRTTFLLLGALAALGALLFERSRARIDSRVGL